MPITIKVGAEADERSFSRVGDQAEKRFRQIGKDAGHALSKGLDDAASKADPKSAERWARAYDKVADSAGKVRVEEAKLADLRTRGASDARLISQSEALERARRAETRATREATSAYQDLRTRTSGLASTIGNLASGTRFGGLIADAQSLSATFGGMGLATGVAITGFAGLAVGIAAAGTKLYELGSMWDSVADGITARTGKIGDDLNGVMDQVTNVALNSSASIGDIGDIAGRVSASIGATGDQLGNLTAYIADLNEMTGEQTNVKQLGMLYRVFGVQAGDQVDVLNQLYTAFTDTQIPVNELIGMLVNAGPKFQQFHMNLGQTVAMLGTFTEAGVDPEKAITGLNKALTKAAAAGKDPQKTLTDVIAKIKELHAAGNDPAAQTLASDFFGAKNFTPFLQAIESGKLAVEDVGGSFKLVTKDIRDTKAETDDFSEEWKRFKNYLQVDLEPVATAVFGAMNNQLKWFTESMHGTIEGIKSAWHWLENLTSGADQIPTAAPPWAKPGTPYTGGPGILSGQGSATGGDPFNPGGIYGEKVMGAPGRGFPLPWTLPSSFTDQSPRDFAHGSMMPFWEGQGFTVGDHGADKYGEHQNGALDIMVPSIEAGAAVMRQVLSDPNVYGAIFNNQTFGYGNGPGARDYTAGHTGNPTQDHQDHVHVWYKPGGGNNIANASPTGSAISSPMRAWGPMPTDMGNTDFGPGYKPGPAGGTPGFNEQGDPGYYVTDPRQIRTAEERIADVKKAIADANDQILQAQQDQLEAIQRAAEIEQDEVATEEQKKAAGRQVVNANKSLARATEQRDRLVGRDLRDANESLADVTRGSFRSAERAASSSRSGGGRGLGQIGAPLANDLGISGGLPGIMQNLTTFLANLAFAPMIGALSGIQTMADPNGMGGSGIIGMMAARSGGIGGIGTGLPALASSTMPGSGIASGGNLFGGPTGTPPGPASTVGGLAPAAGPAGAGFSGLGGLPMAGLQAATAGLDMMAPGAGQAASTGIQLANRAVGFIGQLGGIFAGGLMETLLPNDAAMADPTNSWFGRVAAGVAGSAPALPNMAGQSAVGPVGQQQGGGQGTPAAGGSPITVNYTNNQATEDRAGKDLTNHLSAMYTTPGTG